MLRDGLAAQAREFPSAVLGRQERIAQLDEKLRRRMTAVNSAEGAVLEHTRALIAPPADHWWWYPSHAHPLWTVSALFVLTLSLSLLTDFTRRLLSSDPDELGILSIAFQALLAVGASSTFTESGTGWLRVQLSRRRSWAARPHVVKLLATLALFTIVFSAWEWLPTTLATYYNNAGYHLWTTQPEAALRLYERAIRLDPELPQTHVNLAALYEKNYDYGNASTEYRKALIIDASHLKAYSDLARVLLIEDQSYTALRIIDDAFANRAKSSVDAHTEASMYKNRAWGELVLGFYPEAEKDALMGAKIDPSLASAVCVLAKIYAKEGKDSQAYIAWRAFEKLASAITSQSMIEPDCQRLAQESIHEQR
jgi:tetratricopeptide (TPR) repeat protein